MAMMYSATKRLHEAIPDATIEVITSSPEELKEVCPDVQPLGDDLRGVWLKILPMPIARALPIGVSTALRLIAAKFVLPLFCVFSRRARSARRKANLFLDSVSSAKAMIVTGMGGITDTFGEDAYQKLETMALVLSHGHPVMMVGQGIGPIESRWLRTRAASVLSRVEVIGVREARASVPLLRQLGVPAERIVVTGDDAVELGYQSRSEIWGDGIGFNVRMAYYSGVEGAQGRRVAEIVREEARARSAPTIPLSIASAESDSDIDALLAIVPDMADEVTRIAQISTPVDFMPQVHRCRIVVAGSYHAAVFALSSGIPVVGIASVPYYVTKFEGLQDFFGEGCPWINLNDACWEDALRLHISRNWDNAHKLRDGLLREAARQVGAGRALYGNIADRIAAVGADA
jgi:colanic acid/amylovoran biosynthesis protein